MKLWSPVTSVNEMAVAPEISPPVVTPTLTGGVPLRDIFSNRPFRRALAAITVWVNGAWKSMMGPGSPKSLVDAV